MSVANGMSMTGKSKKALLIIDMINSLDFPEGKSLFRYALPASKNIHRLKKV